MMKESQKATIEIHKLVIINAGHDSNLTVGTRSDDCGVSHGLSSLVALGLGMLQGCPSLGGSDCDSGDDTVNADRVQMLAH
jgi:hypothetical protein